MRWTPAFLPLVGCAHALPPEQPCLEVGYAIAARTAECEGSSEAGVARFEQFEASFVCDLPEGASAEVELSLYECALVVRNLACELALEYGDDLDRWLTSSAACAALLEGA